MSKMRVIQTKFWDDEFITDLATHEKLLFLYFLTNPLTSLSGVYECTLKRISFDTGIGVDAIKKTMDKFGGKIHYKAGWIYVRNFSKHQSFKETTTKALQEELGKLPLAVKAWVAQIDKEYMAQDLENGTLFDVKQMGEIQEQKSAADELLEAQVKEIVEYYKAKINDDTRFTVSAADKVRARLREYSVAELKKAIDRFSEDEWRMAHNRAKGMVWFFFNEDKVAHWLQLKADAPQAQTIKIR